ncbi:MAG: 3-hydroxyacyl-CoA dehydrogenase NAD-binding domain-containing protein [Solirubrobacteraceae bacterium]
MLDSTGAGRQTITVAVLGAGRMGSQIALDYARGGHTVRFTVSKATGQAAAMARLDATSDGQLDIDYARTTADAARGAHLVVESLPEDLALKQQELRIAQTVSPVAILATNTSSLTIASIADGLEDPTRLIGVHYVNPPWAHRIVEVIPGPSTAPAVVQQVDAILVSLGRDPIRINLDTPGFVFNRLQFALLREAIALVESGVVTKEDLDRVVVEGIGRRWGVVGPLTSAALGGAELFSQLAARLYPVLASTDAPSAGHMGLLEMPESEIDAARRTRDARLAAYATDREAEWTR